MKNIRFDSLPQNSLAACEAFMTEHLEKVHSVLAAEDTSSLAIVLPYAPIDQVNWRRALALDLAREFAPKRVNVIGASGELATKKTLAYLRNAPGVTGQYLQPHD